MKHHHLLKAGTVKVYSPAKASGVKAAIVTLDPYTFNKAFAKPRAALGRRAAVQFLANSTALLVRMALNGTGIVAAAPDRFAEPHVRTGALRRVLPDWEVPSVPAWAVFLSGAA